MSKIITATLIVSMSLFSSAYAAADLNDSVLEQAPLSQLNATAIDTNPDALLNGDIKNDLDVNLSEDTLSARRVGLCLEDGELDSITVTYKRDCEGVWISTNRLIGMVRKLKNALE